MRRFYQAGVRVECREVFRLSIRLRDHAEIRRRPRTLEIADAVRPNHLSRAPSVHRYGENPCRTALVAVLWHHSVENLRVVGTHSRNSYPLMTANQQVRSLLMNTLLVKMPD